MTNQNLFTNLLEVRKAMYALEGPQFNVDEITAFEEQVLAREGIDYADYADWKDS